MKKSLNWGNVSMKSNDGAKYTRKRYKELIKKGFSPEEAEKMIYFEIGISTVIRQGIESASAETCMAVGRLVGTEAGATIGAAGGSVQTVGIGSFTGGLIGAYFGKFTCSKIIKGTSEFAIKRTSEHYAKSHKNFNDIYSEIDINYVSSYLENNTKNIADFKPANAIKNTSQNKNMPLQGRVTKNVYVEKTTNTRKFDENKNYSDYINEITNSNKIYTKEDIENMSDKELSDNKEAIDFQKKSIGIPTNKQAKASGMIFVSGYTRSDGIEVKSHYRAHPA